VGRHTYAFHPHAIAMAPVGRPTYAFHPHAIAMAPVGRHTESLLRSKWQ